MRLKHIAPKVNFPSKQIIGPYYQKRFLPSVNELVAVPKLDNEGLEQYITLKTGINALEIWLVVFYHQKPTFIHSFSHYYCDYSGFGFLD